MNFFEYFFIFQNRNFFKMPFLMCEITSFLFFAHNTIMRLEFRPKNFFCAWKFSQGDKKYFSFCVRFIWALFGFYNGLVTWLLFYIWLFKKTAKMGLYGACMALFMYMYMYMFMYVYMYVYMYMFMYMSLGFKLATNDKR